MASSFHFSISMISRRKGKSAVVSAAYISCQKLTNDWDGITHDYQNKKGLLHEEIMLPNHVPKALKDKEIKTNTIKIENLNKCLVYADIIKDNKPIYDEWESKKIFKDSFYKSHKEEIEKSQRAMIQKVIID